LSAIKIAVQRSGRLGARSTAGIEPRRVVADVMRELSLPGNERVLAVVNVETGHVQAYLVPPDARNETTRVTREAEALRREAEALRLIVDRPSTAWTERQRARARLRKLEQLLTDERTRRQPGSPEGAQAGQSVGRPDYTDVSEAGRGLITVIATASIRGEDLGASYDRLPSTINDVAIAAAWQSSREWTEWLKAAPATRRAFVQSAIADLRRADER
jgi:hypothetical protein